MNEAALQPSPSVAKAVHPFFDFNNVPDVVTPRRDKDEVRARLLDQLESVLLYLFPRGKRRGTQFFIGNLQGDPGDSLVIELAGPKRGVWLDFNTGESGDVLALWACGRGYTLPADFGDLLDDAGDWLVVPRIAPTPVVRSAAAHDDLGPHTGKWDYVGADGQLLACVYRYDTPTGKQYQPRDARARAMRMPEPRPRYNLPAIAASDAVVLVEGEKCADALMHFGIVATTAMGGASTAIDKTDWSPLTGKTVAVWPDHDEAGARYADAVIPKLMQIGAKVRRVTVPQDKPKKWDAADAVAEDFDVEGLLRFSHPVADAIQSLEITRWRAADRFIGEPQVRRWLVDGVFPQAQAALIAAAGGVGKSFLLLALAREVAAFDGIWANAPTLFGGSLAGHGVAIYVTAEDDAIEVHNRLNALGPIPDRLYVLPLPLPLPDAGGEVPLFAPDPATRGPATTTAWTDLERQLKAMPGLRLVVLDPLQPLCALDLNVPENAQFVCSGLAALAASTGASVIVSHQFAKREASTPEQSDPGHRWPGRRRALGLRAVEPEGGAGQGHLQDAGRALRAWPRRQGQRPCQPARGDLPARRPRLAGLPQSGRDPGRQDRCDLLPTFKAAIARAAVEGQPYTKTGGNGVYERRHELPEAFHAIGKHRLADWVGMLLDREELAMAMAQGSKLVKWLDVPGGPVASGQAVFVTGHLGRSGAGRPDGD